MTDNLLPCPICAEVARLEAELNELKEAVSWEGRDPHLAAWRKECFDRDQSASVLDSDIVSLIDRAGMARTEVARLQERVRVLGEALDNAKHALADARCQLTGVAKDEASMAIASAEAALAQPQPLRRCVCGEPGVTGIVHSGDAPCYSGEHCRKCHGAGIIKHRDAAPEGMAWYSECPDCKPQQKEKP